MPDQVNPISKARYFIAMAANESSQQSISELVQLLKANTNYAIRWVEPANYHLTIKFLGNSTSVRMARLAEDLKQALHLPEPIILQTQKIIFLPNAKPKVLVLAVKLNKMLAELRQTIEALASAHGFELATRPFIPHVTLARSKQAFILKQSQYLARLEFETPAIFRSITTEQGICYEKLTT